MARKKPTVAYICESCGNTFEAEQGSRRRYCGECLAKKVSRKESSHGKKAEEEQ